MLQDHRASVMGARRGSRWETWLVRRIAGGWPGARAEVAAKLGRQGCRWRFSFCLRHSSERIAGGIVDFFVPRNGCRIVLRSRLLICSTGVGWNGAICAWFFTVAREHVETVEHMVYVPVPKTQAEMDEVLLHSTGTCGRFPQVRDVKEAASNCEWTLPWS